MAKQRVSDAIHQTQRYLGEHPLLRWFVVPLFFMAGIVVLAGSFSVLLPVGLARSSADSSSPPPSQSSLD